MANQPYGTYGSYVSSRLSADPYSSVRNSDLSKYTTSYDYGTSLFSNPSELGSFSTWSGLTSAGLSLGVKRSADALYSQNDLGSLNTIGHDALLSSTSMFKHPRIESSSHLPLYPQRPGEKDCAHYMLTRACKFGEACKFDHPMWVPEGGIPNWKEGLVAPAAEVPPERPGEPDCPYYMKTQRCKYGSRCKFNHPKNKLNVSAIVDGTETEPSSLLPERPGEPICAYYSKTGNCRFGATCKFHHPKDIQIQPTEQNPDQATSAMKNIVPFAPALFQNSKGLPVRPGETDCPFYLKTGSCKYSTTCRYNHPERNEISPLLAPNINQTILSSAGLPVSLFSAAANLFPSLDPLFSKASLGAVSNLFPQRPGQTECDYYMKTGKCTFGERCKYHHPIDRSAINAAPAAGQIQSNEPNVKLTLAGLPRREGAVACPFYMKTGMCKYAVTCRFDHPPPGEAVAKATTLGSGAASAEPTD